MKKFTKIVATVSDMMCDEEYVRKLIKSGVNVVRLNTAHMDYEGLCNVVKTVRSISDKVATLVDTKGPEIRTTPTEDGNKILVAKGDTLLVKGSPDTKSTAECICVSYEGFVADMSVDGDILIDDGETALKVIEKNDDHLVCRVENDGEIGGKKSVNVPGVRINLPSLTEKDIRFIGYAAEQEVDFIAHSFVRNAADVADVQAELDRLECPAKIIAKIENQEGVDNIDEIIECVYGVMIARGDMGIEIAQEKIPGIQRQLIRKCVERKKPVIVATQMLHTMIKNPRPTRAEVTDVANAIYYRTDAIMLSGETAYGNYGVEAVRTMSEIAREVEDAKDNRNDIPVPNVAKSKTTYLADTAVKASDDLNIKAIITDSFTGRTARYLAAFRGRTPIYGLCYNKRTARELNLSYGIFPRVMEQGGSKEEIMIKTLNKLKRKEILSDQDQVAYLGSSFGIGGGTSFLEIITVEDLLKRTTEIMGK
ncbi:pyruvate kinase [Saccharicrinis fermentans]|uniref:Pyruvate kinase n=1 Tax=Saccharicrinis fermentans DSM 9555 = JCM 21142 TaxID=869213 RepID=W7Y8M8_9BACT|nr:pyruvate kinase [Saccharicrinis fermentans]GAF04053.1 pyruvate kinase [Saccharicrinis fermentans DSM 9555 = JCM 21142]